MDLPTVFILGVIVTVFCFAALAWEYRQPIRHLFTGSGIWHEFRHVVKDVIYEASDDEFNEFLDHYFEVRVGPVCHPVDPFIPSLRADTIFFLETRHGSVVPKISHRWKRTLAKFKPTHNDFRILSAPTVQHDPSKPRELMPLPGMGGAGPVEDLQAFTCSGCKTTRFDIESTREWHLTDNGFKCPSCYVPDSVPPTPGESK